MIKQEITDPKIKSITSQVAKAAQDVLGDKLVKVILFGSYARGDYNEESDIDIFVLADVPNEETTFWYKKIWEPIPYLDLDNDKVISIHVTAQSLFNEWEHHMPYFKNVATEGVSLVG